MLAFFTLLIMAAVAYAFLREGMFTGCVMTINILASGLVAFNFFEPVADWLDDMVADSFVHGYEDSMALVTLFCLSLGGLRWLTNTIATAELDFDPMILRGGGLVFGLVAGYLISGFLMCVLQTLPWHENFMNFEYKIDAEKGSQAMRKFLPPDRLWLAMIQRASIGSFRTGQEEEMTPFDKNATFEIRYARYRRYGEGREALTHQGECKAREDQ